MLPVNSTRLRVVVASLNAAKIDSARLAFAQLLAHTPIAVQITGVDVRPGVAEQPMSDAETYQGAKQRALAARALMPDADLWIGMEGGVEFMELVVQGLPLPRCTAFAWIQVLGPELDNASRSASLTLPPAVAKALAEGEALGPAMDRLFKHSINSNQGNSAEGNNAESNGIDDKPVGSKPSGGAIGILTQQHLTRRSVYRDTLLLALAPWLAPEIYS